MKPTRVFSALSIVLLIATAALGLWAVFAYLHQVPEERYVSVESPDRSFEGPSAYGGQELEYTISNPTDRPAQVVGFQNG